MKSDKRARYQYLADILRRYRIAADLTQSEVATRLGMPQSFVSKMESGERRLDVIELIDVLNLYGQSISNVERELTLSGKERRVRSR